MRLLAPTLALALIPAGAFAGSMPQMDFHNPLTVAQVVWMVVILVVLYLALSRWGLPEMGKVLESRAQVIAADLTAARAAKTEADQAVAALQATIAQARAKAQAEVADMITKAKARAAANAASLAARLDKNMAESEARIGVARAEAMAALKPVAEDAAHAILRRLTGAPAPDDIVARRVEDALAAARPA
jgi:F-type H+-transporting ATPase subunit b